MSTKDMGEQKQKSQGFGGFLANIGGQTETGGTENGDDASVDSYADIPEEQNPIEDIEIEITVMQGRNLVAKDTDLFGKATASDPFVEVKVHKREGPPVSVGKTKTKEKTLTPVWNETLKFKVDADELKWMKGTFDLEVGVYDQDFMSTPESMGNLIIPVSLTNSTNSFPEWYELTPDADDENGACGELEIAFKATIRFKKIVILYGYGGLSDVGRHAVIAALERTDVTTVKVLTKHKDLLDQKNWDCSCPEPHSFTFQDKVRMNVVPVKSWDDKNIGKHFQGACAVVSCLGNRQPGTFDKLIKAGWDSAAGNKAVIRAMKQHSVRRSVVISSVGIAEDWPPMEWHWDGHKMASQFRFFSKDAVQDLTHMEQEYHDSDLDFLIVRPVNMDQSIKPVTDYRVQEEKGKDKLGVQIAKLDVARYMIEEAVNPTRHREGIVVGSQP
jgi:hypothetical protein